MDINEYESLTGITVATSQEALITATITKTQSILESILGYTLDESKVDINQYTELGKTPSECPNACDIDIDNLIRRQIVSHLILLARSKRFYIPALQR